MALIKCRECGNQISDKATACPSCGAPQLPVADVAGVVTTQATGKRFKALQLLGVLLILSGTVACSNQSHGSASILWVVGSLAYVAGRVGAWWSHG